MRTCRVCQQPKPLSEFYRSRSDCRACRRAYATKYRNTAKGKAKYLKYTKKYRNSVKGKNTKKCYHQYYKESGKTLIAHKKYRQTEKSKNAKKRYLVNHPDQQKAWYAVTIAVRNGKLPHSASLQCHYCPAKAIQYHHYLGYEPEHWLDVVPACRKCHDIKHRKIA